MKKKIKIDKRFPTCPDCGLLLELASTGTVNFGKKYDCNGCNKSYVLECIEDRNEYDDEEDEPELYCEHCKDYGNHETEEHTDIVGPILNELPPHIA